jgi:hypothetical protein
MDIGHDGGDIGGFGDDGGFEDQPPKKLRALPDDLPKSLDDRKNVSTHFTQETEMYDAWQGDILLFLRISVKHTNSRRAIAVFDDSLPCETFTVQ